MIYFHSSILDMAPKRPDTIADKVIAKNYDILAVTNV